MKCLQIGVDIQIPKTKNLSGFQKKYQLTRMNHSNFLEHWTKVEAYCKATQSSLYQSLYPNIDQKILDNDLHYWSTDKPYRVSLISNEPIHDVIVL